jgi:hypothetical protein
MIDYAAVAAARERDLAQASRVTCLTCQLVSNGSQVSTSPQVGVRIEAARAATLDDGVEDGAALAGIGIAEEEPVFLSEHGGTNVSRTAPRGRVPSPWQNPQSRQLILLIFISLTCDH